MFCWERSVGKRPALGNVLVPIIWGKRYLFLNSPKLWSYAFTEVVITEVAVTEVAITEVVVTEVIFITGCSNKIRLF